MPRRRRHASGLGSSGEACCSKESAFEVLAAQGLGNGGLAGRGAVTYPAARAMPSLPRGRQARHPRPLLLVSLQPLANIGTNHP